VSQGPGQSHQPQQRDARPHNVGVAQHRNIPDDPHIREVLRHADALQVRGEHAGAARALHGLLATGAPATPAIHVRLASIAVARQDHATALAHLGAACDLAPGDPALRMQFGSILAHTGRHEDALAEFGKVTSSEPGNIQAWYFTGLAAARSGRRGVARESWQRVLRIAPEHEGALQALADLEFNAGFPRDALPLWETLHRQQPRSLDARLKTGECLSRLGWPRKAAELYREGLEIDPGSAELWLALGQAEEDDGNRDAAIESYVRAIGLRPHWAYPLACLVALQRADVSDDLLSQATALQGSALDDHDRSLLGYAVGRAWDARGEHARALASWEDANAARQRMIGPPDPSAMRARVESLMRFFPPGFVDGSRPAGSDDPRPVFIVGMPRSGTTLTEQILAHHPQVHGCGELPDITMIARELPADPARIDRESLRWAVDRYLETATRHAPDHARRLVDKEPLNFFQLGLVAMMFPRARIVWCRRDPRDVAVSIYSENFALDETLATDFIGIAHYINLQHALMRHWQAVLPLPILELRYEELAAAPEPQARRLLEFAGLDWDPACLEFHGSGRAVQTPSRWQVRQPVHTRAIGRWRNYASAIEPLVAHLDPELRDLS
jgi:tetratricopeptide (TPR) repeat protein